MEKILEGKNKVLMFRLVQDRAKKSAARLALQVKHSVKESSKTESIQTKDGTIAKAGEVTTTISIEALASDTLVNKMLRHAVRNQLEVEVWEIDFSKKQSDGKYLAEYGTGYLGSWEVPSDVKANTTIKTTMTINGQLVVGEATVTELDELTVKNFFRDTVVNAEEVAPLTDY